MSSIAAKSAKNINHLEVGMVSPIRTSIQYGEKNPTVTKDILAIVT